MIYINIKTNEQVGINKIRRETGMSIPDGANCEEFGYKKLILTEKPVQDGYIAIEKEPINYTQTWELVVDTSLEDVRVAEIWEQIREQEALSVRALLNNDTVWIEKRKQNILDLKGRL